MAGSDDVDKFLNFGKYNLNNLIGTLFWLGTLPQIFYACMMGNYVFRTNTVEKVIQQARDTYTIQEVNNLPLGVLAGIASFILGVILWRIFCEIVFIIVRYFKNNTNMER